MKNNKLLIKKREVLYGTSLKDVISLLITPIESIYECFRSLSDKETCGWWKTLYLNKNTVLVKSSTGTHSKDVVYYAPNVVNLFLIGYCGSCDERISVGDKFSAESAQRGNNIIHSNFDFKQNKEKKGRTYHVESLCEQEKKSFIKKMVKKGISCIDMETYPIFEIASERASNFGSLCIVTDNLINMPFYEVGFKMNEEIRKSLSEIVNQVYEIISK